MYLRCVRFHDIEIGPKSTRNMNSHRLRIKTIPVYTTGRLRHFIILYIYIPIYTSRAYV